MRKHTATFRLYCIPGFRKHLIISHPFRSPQTNNLSILNWVVIKILHWQAATLYYSGGADISFQSWDDTLRHLFGRKRLQ